ncbi:hypothetical protein E4U40_005531 [Claviceps sp. LM458 group G5]|nr:hypothetical protein E4U40_005531 [Claviceps sp. LM458 group G5]
MSSARFQRPRGDRVTGKVGLFNPDFNGLELARRKRSGNVTTPIMSASALELEAEAVQRGSVSYQ